MFYTPGPRGGLTAVSSLDVDVRGGATGSPRSSHTPRSSDLQALQSSEPWLDASQIDAIRAFLMECGPSVAWAEHAVAQPPADMLCSLFSIGARLRRVGEFFEANAVADVFAAALSHPKTVALAMLHSELRQGADDKTVKRSLETVTPLLRALVAVGVDPELYAIYDAGYVDTHATRKVDSRRSERELAELMDGNSLALFPDRAAEFVRRIEPLMARNAAVVSRAHLRDRLLARLDRND